MMKILLIALGIVLAVVAPAASTDWYSEGQKTNPVVNTVMADTGPVTQGRWVVRVICDSSVTGAFMLEHRDSGGNVLYDQALTTMGNSPAQWELISTASDDDTFMVRMRLGITLGTAQCSIIWPGQL